MLGIFREILQGQRAEREEHLKKPYIAREGLEEARKRLNNPLIQVIVGPRRAGKSVFCLQLLKDTPFAYVNFDDERLIGLKDCEQLLSAMREAYGPTKRILFDEIQNLDRWELFVNRLQREGYRLVITGSNSRLLSRELATHLTGRHLNLRLFPFSFREYLLAKTGSIPSRPLLQEREGDLKHHLENYIQVGGYPEVVVQGVEPNSYLKTLFESILFKDIVRRYRVRFPQKLHDLATHLLTHHAAEFSYTALRKFLAFRSIATVENYAGFLEEAFLLLKVGRFSFSSKERVKSPKKAYGIDSGMINAVRFQTSRGIGRLMENMVALELNRREKEFYSYKTKTGREVDFVLKEGAHVTELIQVCYDLSEPGTKEREIRSLVQSLGELRSGHGVVLTWDEEAEEKFAGETIRFVPLWSWLLG